MSTNQAVVVAPAAPARLAIRIAALQPRRHWKRTPNSSASLAGGQRDRALPDEFILKVSDTTAFGYETVSGERDD